MRKQSWNNNDFGLLQSNSQTFWSQDSYILKVIEDPPKALVYGTLNTNIYSITTNFKNI